MTNAFKCDSCQKYIDGFPSLKIRFGIGPRLSVNVEREICRHCGVDILTSFLHYEADKAEDLLNPSVGQI